MTTGEKITALRKQKGITQEQLAEILKVSRQSVSRWEMDTSFPETEKLIKLGRILECSIDYLLNDAMEAAPKTGRSSEKLSPMDCFLFLRECSCFFLATSVSGRPRLRPMGMIHANDEALFLVTDKRKNVYSELAENPLVELAGYNLYTRKWIRISGKVNLENSPEIRAEMLELYPLIRQEYSDRNEIYSVIFRLQVENVSIQ